MSLTPPIVLTIAGSDSGGGAGVQADLKTFAALRCYGTSVLTAVTAQNTVGVHDVYAMPGSVVRTQLDAVLADLRPAAAKIGMLGTAEVAGVVAAKARAGQLPNLVVDPVMTSSTGSRLGQVTAIERLLPYAKVITPNIEETAALVGWRIETPADMAAAAGELAAAGPACVVVTGGDLPGEAESVDAVWLEGAVRFLRARRVATQNTHGTGCTFSAAVATRLALGITVSEAVEFAKSYVSRALAGGSQWRLGAGMGPVDHFEWSYVAG